MNHVILMGNLTRDPECKFLQSGMPVCEFGLAVNKVWKDKSGAKQEKVGFFDCTAWGKTAETIAKYFTKGKKILIEGELDYQAWEDKTSGQKRSKIKLQVSRFHFLPDGKGRDSNQDARQSLSGEDNQDGVNSYLDPDTGAEVPF